MNTVDRPRQAGTVNFFISYTGSDVEWAKWVAWELGRAGYTYRIAGGGLSPGDQVH